ncbi:fatty-acid-binding protein 2 isoform X2 [Cinnamomum micranthum f. kanehirae]|uniref:Fatty-acid-binding protein 2 isoform X2 n=1 Tax=Cinnamomum micranthum f. kanehirae TaxID=337451 RepID=A0A3S3NP37_9MAGN|nr:fatty-acid-binding protein 2 isoform X2 [Cinnamomum micranthum f. kanehirae]
MRICWLFFTNLDFNGGYQAPDIVPIESHIYNSRYFDLPGSFALQEAFSCFSKFAGALLFWISGGQNSNGPHKLSRNPHGSRYGNRQACIQGKHITSYRHSIMGLRIGSRSRVESFTNVLFSKIVNSTIGNLWKDVGQLESLPIFSLAAAFVPPYENLSSNTLGVPLENTDEQIKLQMDNATCEDEQQRCSNLFLTAISWKADAIEPRTGIKFPTVLEAGDNSFNPPTKEVLVGVGSRSMTIVKVKSLNLYAFGLYVQPDSVCKKLGPKYASVPIGELKNQRDFFEDLLREDIHMTVRLVVNYSGLKINTVRDAFEKSLRARLLKVNPNTDYDCLRAFGSSFTQDIPLPAGTTIDFRQTSNGKLTTEIGGMQIGAVHSKDLCRAFFDMYIGDGPVSVKAKQEIGSNVASIIKRC